MNRRLYLQSPGSEFDREFALGRDGFAFETNGQEWEMAVNRSSADYIKWVQQSLNSILGLRLAADGTMGPQTRNAIRSFQQQRGLKPDGLLGPQTEAALIGAGAAPRTGTSSIVDFGPLIVTAPPTNPQRSSCPPFTLVAVETPGGGRIQNKTIPNSSDIVIVQGAFAQTPLHRLAAEALNALVCAARADGIRHPQLLPTGSISGFRSVKLQESIRRRSEATHGSKDLGTWVGKPGFSAHQSGRAIDFYLGTANDRGKVAILRQTPAYKWMVANAHRFGFYPYPVEPWHWEYNPPAAAQPEVFSEVGESFEYEDEFADFGWGLNYSNDVPAVAGELSSTGVNRSSPVYIQWVQNSLNKILGLRLLVDGDPGPQTRFAIRSFQRRAGLDDDGKVGAQTERALIAAGASTPSGANILAGSNSAPVPPSATSTPGSVSRGSAPRLLGSDTASYGKTLYLEIGLGIGKNLASTGVYIPNSFRPESEIVIVLYLHGWKGDYPGNAVLINGYWDGARFPFFALREEVNASGQNVIFVAPSLGPKSEAGSLRQPGGFDAFMKQVLSGLNEHYLMPRYGSRIRDVQSIILAAHSGGGSPMLRLATGTDQYARKIKECWCYDSMYGPVAQDWLGWAKSHPQQSLYVYSGPAKGGYDATTGKQRVLPRDNAEAIARQRLANVCVQPSRAKSVGKVSAHFWVPIVHLKERLLNSPCV